MSKGDINRQTEGQIPQRERVELFRSSQSKRSGYRVGTLALPHDSNDLLETREVGYRVGTL